MQRCFPRIRTIPLPNQNQGSLWCLSLKPTPPPLLSLQGPHVFVVRIRDDAGRLMPGVRIKDQGPKMGLNGVDNGRIWFDHVRVPREVRFVCPSPRMLKWRNSMFPAVTPGSWPRVTCRCTCGLQLQMLQHLLHTSRPSCCKSCQHVSWRLRLGCDNVPHNAT